MNKKLVSVIVPCYNQAHFLEEALQSVLKQSYTHWECIIVNDGSEDITETVANNWCKKDKRFKYLCKENGGLSSARNFGIDKAGGDFIIPLDADDKIAADYIKLALEAFNNDDGLKIVYCEAEYFGDKSGRWNLLPYSYFTLLRQNMIFCSAVFKKSDWQLVGGYDPKMIYGFEDWEFWIHILKHGGTVKKLELTGFYYRVKSQSMVKNMTEDHIIYSNNYVWKKHKDAFVKNYDLLLEERQLNASQLRSRKFVTRLFFNRLFRF